MFRRARGLPNPHIVDEPLPLLAAHPGLGAPLTPDAKIPDGVPGTDNRQRPVQRRRGISIDVERGTIAIFGESEMMPASIGKGSPGIRPGITHPDSPCQVSAEEKLPVLRSDDAEVFRVDTPGKRPALHGVIAGVREEDRARIHAAVTVHLQDVAREFERTGLGGRGAGSHFDVTPVPGGVATAVCRVVEIPPAQQPRLIAGELRGEVRANLLHAERHVPDADIIHRAGEFPDGWGTPQAWMHRALAARAGAGERAIEIDRGGLVAIHHRHMHPVGDGRLHIRHPRQVVGGVLEHRHPVGAQRHAGTGVRISAKLLRPMARKQNETLAFGAPGSCAARQRGEGPEFHRKIVAHVREPPALRLDASVHPIQHERVLSARPRIHRHGAACGCLAGARIAHQFPIVMIRRRIAAGLRGIGEIPQPHQLRLGAGEFIVEVLANLLRAPHAAPEPHFFELAMKAVGRIERARSDEMPVGSAHRGKAAGVRGAPDERPVEVKLRPASVKSHREMMPLVESQRPRLGDDVFLFGDHRSRLGWLGPSRGWAFSRRIRRRRGDGVGRCGLQLEIRRAGLVADFHPLRRVEFKHMFIGLERLPFDPALERRRVQALEHIRRQLQIVAAAAQRQDSGLRCGDKRRSGRDHRPRIAHQFPIVMIRRRIAARIRRVVEIPQRHQPRLAAGQLFQEVLADLLGRARDFPHTDLIHRSVQLAERSPAIVSSNGSGAVLAVSLQQGKESFGAPVEERSIGINAHSVLRHHHCHMGPPTARQNSGSMNVSGRHVSVWASAHVQGSVQLGAIPVHDTQSVVAFAETEKARPRSKFIPADPAFDCHFLQPANHVRWQLDITGHAV